MKSLIFLCSYLVAVQTQDLTNMTIVELLELLGETIQVREGDVQESDVTLFLYTRNNPSTPVELFLKGKNQLDTSKSTKFLIHGWLENYLVEWYAELKNELLKYEDVNVIEVDWNRVARSYYVSSARNTQLVGNILGKFVLETGLPPENVHFIGHSLGAHVAGFGAKSIKQYSNEKIKRISGLDPAGPYFRLPTISINEKLSRADADIVDVIHTDGGFFGFDKPVGTLDIYVNGGRRRQPGCHDGEPSFDIQELIRNALCSHGRSHAYFIQTINNAKIVCRKCASYEALRNNTCSDTKIFTIVHQNISNKMEGICRADTNGEPPFFKNIM